MASPVPLAPSSLGLLTAAGLGAASEGRGRGRRQQTQPQGRGAAGRTGTQLQGGTLGTAVLTCEDEPETERAGLRGGAEGDRSHGRLRVWRDRE